MHIFVSLFLTISLLLSSAPLRSAAEQTESPISTETSDDASMDTQTEVLTVTEADSNVPDTGAVNISAPSAVLMESSTGTILYDKDAHAVLRPASITKIMTLILIFDALEKQAISLEDEVSVSEHAASMGGSQVFLEPGEIQTVDTMIKCISVASANDACVAMAEFIAGSEEAFVMQMNERAAGLGMTDTNFVNCCGLDVDGHVTSAYDVALMSRELITRYPQIHDYTTIWMENITHVTRRGSSEFGLTNTNKLIKQYPYANGLKTGSTGLAKYCVSATAKKDDIQLIAVIMAAPDYKIRFQDASSLLNYGFGICRLYQDNSPAPLPTLTVKGGTLDNVSLRYEGNFSYLDTAGSDLNAITREIQLPEEVSAPIEEGAEAGRVVYQLNGKEIGSLRILYSSGVEKASFKDYLMRTLELCFSL